MLIENQPAIIISTHTLTWSVTIFVMPPTKGEIDFNSHAHVERDCVTMLQQMCQIDFNSHAHVERDTFSVNLDTGAFISTHTLTWSVTRLDTAKIDSGEDFNSHAHVERDRDIMLR